MPTEPVTEGSRSWKSIFKKGWLLPAGVVSRAACQWLILVVLATWGSAEAVGTLTAPLALANLPFVLFGFGMRNVYLTHVNRLSIQWYVRTRIALLSCATAFATIGALALGTYDYQIVALVCAIKFAEAFVDILIVADQESDRQGMAGLILALLGLGSLVGFVVGYAIHPTVVSGQIGWLASNAIITIGYYVYVRRYYSTAYTHSSLSPRWPVLSAGFSTGVAQATGSAQSSIPVLFLNQTSSAADVGVFSLIFYFLTLFNLAAMGYLQKVLPHSVKEDAAGPHTRKAARVLLAAAVLISTATIVFGEEAGVVLYGISDDISRTAYALIGASILCSSLSLSSGMKLAVRQLYRFQMATGLAGAIATVVFCAIAGENLGIEQALAAVALGYAVRAFLNFLGSRTLANRDGAGTYKTISM